MDLIHAATMHNFPCIQTYIGNTDDETVARIMGRMFTEEIIRCFLSIDTTRSRSILNQLGPNVQKAVRAELTYL